MQYHHYLTIVLFTVLTGATSLSAYDRDYGSRHRIGRGDIDLHDVTPNLDVVAAPNEHTEELISVDQQARAQDYEESFRTMIRQNPNGRAYAIVDGIRLDKVVGVKAMSNDTLLVLTLERGSHQEQQVVKVEDIEMLGMHGSTGSPVKRPSGW